MALINCRNCGKEISDKALICPGCGFQFEEKTETNEANLTLCEECGEVIAEGSDACSKCGCPVSKEIVKEAIPQKVELTSVNLPINKKLAKKHKMLAAIVAIIIVLTSIVGIAVKGNKKKEYYNNLESATNLMLEGAADAENACNLIKSVWYNTIYEEYDSKTDKYTRSNGYGFNDDFNDSLQALFSDQDFKDTITDIEVNQNSVARYMKDLQNPPEEYKEAYDAIKKLYDSYLELSNLAVNPTGSLQTFSNNFNSADSETLQNYEAMKLYLD